MRQGVDTRPVYITTVIIADERNANSSQNGVILFDGIARYGEKVNSLKQTDREFVRRTLEEFEEGKDDEDAK